MTSLSNPPFPTERLRLRERDVEDGTCLEEVVTTEGATGWGCQVPPVVVECRPSKGVPGGSHQTIVHVVNTCRQGSWCLLSKGSSRWAHDVVVEQTVSHSTLVLESSLQRNPPIRPFGEESRNIKSGVRSSTRDIDGKDMRNLKRSEDWLVREW